MLSILICCSLFYDIPCVPVHGSWNTLPPWCRCPIDWSSSVQASSGLCNVLWTLGVHTEFICPTSTRMSTVFMHFSQYSGLHCYLCYLTSSPTFTTQLDLECLRSISGISLSLPTLPGTSCLWCGDSKFLLRPDPRCVGVEFSAVSMDFE